MLGPNDLDDWYDEDTDTRARLRISSAFLQLKAAPGLTALPHHTPELFALAKRFSRDEILTDAEVEALARVWEACGSESWKIRA